MVGHPISVEIDDLRAGLAHRSASARARTEEVAKSVDAREPFDRASGVVMKREAHESNEGTFAVAREVARAA